MERGGCEEEAGSPPGEYIKPHELLEHNMDSKNLHLHAQAIYFKSNTSSVFHSNRFQIPNTYFLFYEVMLFFGSLVEITLKMSVTFHVHSSVQLPPPQEGLCSLWFGASCFRSSLYCIGLVQAVIHIQEGVAQ